MKKLTISSDRKRQVIDITERVERFLTDTVTASEGVCVLMALHTTAALTVADMDPGTDLDMLDALEAMIPKLEFRHPHDPGHARDHILSAVIGPSLSVPFAGGRLALGTWQRVVLVELDGPREREVTLSFVEAA